MSVALTARLTHMHSSLALPARLVLFPRDKPQVLAVLTPERPGYHFYYKCHFDLGMYTGQSPDPGNLIFPLPFKTPLDTIRPTPNPKQHVYTFALPAATPVVAVRGGIVALVRDNKQHSRRIRNFNRVIIYHHDGTYSCYENIAHNSVVVRPGQPIQQGEVIASFGGNKHQTALWFSVRYPDKTCSEAAPIVFSDGEKPIPFR
ncbi:M23 family metallopeptidase [Hymenobacter volaticus]|uniref:M23 family metallopeptidase n=1 Tax=Hymenobacter volaticus TaxID=2932254 RepID=A0ABY4GED4_9BACT|nr:M23 family metallopeptidase [Hymenobacter volaticus]UOQ69155.1 M23 family metallopeptidase [Hymenobacter volaticus]